MGVKSMKLVADFETTTQKEDVRVWAACAVDIDSNETVFLDTKIEAFFKFLEDKNTTVYFHNLKFDGSFLLPYILKHYKFDRGVQSGPYPSMRVHQPGTFDTLITEDNIVYSITVYFKKIKKTWCKAVFYDSLKKLPFSVSTVARAFKLKDRKLVIDYNAYRAPDHKLTEHEIEYIEKDCKIVAQALKIQFDNDLTRMTQASDAMADYKAIIGKRTFDYWFPTLPIIHDDVIRKAYRGGFTYLKPEHAGKRGMQGITLDVNSLYPWAMYNCLLPYGYPKRFEGEYEPDEDFPLYIVKLTTWFIIKPGHIPCIQLKKTGRFLDTEYLTEHTDRSSQPAVLWLTNVDLELILDHYDLIDPVFDGGYMFKGSTEMFRPYIDKWMKVKENSEGGQRQLAKLMLNGLYGRFAINPHTGQKIPVLDRDGMVHYVMDEEGEDRDPVYTAMGCFITTYARNKTIRSAQAVFDRFIYADTDSLHLIGHELPEGLEIHKSHLGAWKNEGEWIDSKFLRAKRYMETMREEKPATLINYARLICDPHTARIERVGDVYRFDKTHVTCAGMPDNVKAQVTYENFEVGESFWGKLTPVHYPGGVILEEGPFTIH